MRIGLYLVLGLLAAAEWSGLFLYWKTTEPSDQVEGEVASSAAAEKPVAMKGLVYAGVIRSDLWHSAADARLPAHATEQLADIFAWQLDFSRDLRPNDRWRLSLEPGPAATAVIACAEIVHDGQIYRAVRFQGRYYSPEGGSLERQFLRTPLAQTHITSGFTKRRFHPILRVHLPHLGVDYAAPRGTPVLAAGDGVVLVAAAFAGSGKMLAVRHGQTYETKYKHLARFAPGLRPGSRVKLGQTIGYVGSTGLATGPHLHYEFYADGKVINPEAMVFPAVVSVPDAQRSAFDLIARNAAASLPAWTQEVTMATTVPH